MTWYRMTGSFVSGVLHTQRVCESPFLLLVSLSSSCFLALRAVQSIVCAFIVYLSPFLVIGT